MKNIIQKAKEYKTRVAGAWIPINKDDIDSKISGNKLYASTKIDGEFSMLYFDGKISVLINSSGKILDNIHFLPQITQTLQKQNISSLIMCAELHVKSNGRCRVFEVRSALKSNPDDILLSGFEILELDSKEYQSSTYEDTLKTIKGLFEDIEDVNVVSYEIISSSQLHKLFEDIVVNQNQEGLVIRSDDSPMVYKLKPIHTVDVAIIGFTQGEDGKVREILMGLLDENNHFIQVGKVGIGLSEIEKENLYNILKDIVVDSRYIEVDSRRVAFAMVKPQIVVEISVNDVITQTTKGDIENPLIKYEDSAGYTLIKNINGTSFIHPVFKKIREDKSINSHDVRYKQITDVVYIDASSQSIQELPKSEIILREVYTKKSKSKTNVQKFIVWKTNKEEIDDKYLAYVLNYTNFSPTRGEPLKKEVRISNSKEQILNLLDEFKTKNIKKGWQIVE